MVWFGEGGARQLGSLVLGAIGASPYRHRKLLARDCRRIIHLDFATNDIDGVGQDVSREVTT
jgi:hypothetical protein